LFSDKCLHPLYSYLLTVFLTGIMFSFAVSDLHAQAWRDSDIAQALKKIVPCKNIEVKTKAGEDKGGKLKSLSIRFESVSKKFLPSDYVTVQYANPAIDVSALKGSNTFHVISYTDFKIGVLVSNQSLKNEFNRMAKILDIRYNKFLIKYTPPYIELEFDIPANGIPPNDRKLVEKFVKNKKFEGYAALRLEVRDNKIIASPVKVILNHFLLPATVTDEIKKRINPVYDIPQIQPFHYSFEKVGIQKKYIYLSN
jgi:hypothetical protein